MSLTAQNMPEQTPIDAQLDLSNISAAPESIRSLNIQPGSTTAAALAAVIKAQAFLALDEDPKAISACNAALKVLRQNGAPLLRSWALSIKATSSATIGLHKEAMAIGTEALQIAQKHNDKALQARAFFSISFVGLESGDMDHAAKMLDRCLACAEEAGSDYDIYWSLNNRSHIYGEAAEENAARGVAPADNTALHALLKTAKRALDVAQTSQDWRHRCYAMLNLANGYFLQGDFLKARELITEYGTQARDGKNSRLTAYATLDEARLLASEGDIAAAVALLSDPSHLDEMCASNDLRLRTRDTLATMEQQAGNFENALHHLRKARDLEREIQKFQSERHLNVLTAEMAMEEALTDARRLRAESNELELRNRFLEMEREELKRNAMLDALTNLGNRRAADAALLRELRQAQTSKRTFHVAYADVDHFKSVNDSFGHPLGDQVLIQIGQLLQDGLRGKDEVFRFGGEEFIVVLHEADCADAMDICERLRQRVENYDWATLDPMLRISASFGVASWQDDAVVGSLLARADEALYRAKKTGRNKVVS